MFANGITPYIKYNMFHAEDKRKRLQNPFLVQNLFYNDTDDYFVCPMGQHMEHVDNVVVKSDLGYESTVSRYRAQNFSRCPLRGMYCLGTQHQKIHHAQQGQKVCENNNE